MLLGMQWDNAFRYAVGRCFEVCSGTMFLGTHWDDVFRYAVGRCF
jgi:ribosomal protein S27AE